MHCHRCHSSISAPLPIIGLPLCPACWVCLLEQIGWQEMYAVLAELAQVAPPTPDIFTTLLRTWLPMMPLASAFAPMTAGAPAIRVEQAQQMWQAALHARRQYEAIADQAGPETELQFLILAVVRSRRHYRRYLRQRFQYDNPSCSLQDS